jgi:hypothetical protein
MSISRCRDKVHDQNWKSSWITNCSRLRDPLDTIAVPIRLQSSYYGRIENKRSADKSERKEEIGLFARMNTFEGSPDRLDDALRNVRE